MKKLLNTPEAFVDETIEGILLAHCDRLRAASDDARALVRTAMPRGTVGIVTGGGSGHLPLFLGYVGEGLCSGVAVGNVFSSPSSGQILAATVASDTGAGVLYLYGNYGGDVFNFDLAADLAAAQGIRTATVLAADDVASAPADLASTRRGVAGILFAYKIAGAAAARGDDLDAVAALTRRAVESTGTMGVGLSPTVLPTTGKPSFDLEEGRMEIGIGIHGEPGRRTGLIAAADEVADELLQSILDDRGISAGDRVAVLVNGLGATPLEELYVLYRRVRQVLDARGVDVYRSYVGEYATSLEMVGVSISVIALDAEFAELLDASADSPFFAQIGSDAASRWRASDGTEEAGDEPSVPADGSVASADLPPTSMDGAAAAVALRRAIVAVAPRWAAHADELRDLDAALGDGDLGITVSSGASAAAAAAESAEHSSPSAVLLSAGSAFATANPSTFAALVGGGLLAAGQRLGGESALTNATLAAALTALADRIAERGGASPGDKTVLDALIPSIDALAAASGDPREVVQAMRDAAWEGVRSTAGSISRKGRAAWVGDRSAGRPDPGATAYARLLDAVADWLDERG